MRVRVYVKDAAGHDLHTHEADGAELTGLGGQHVVPGMGLGRDCPGFINELYVLRDGESVRVPGKEGAPLRIVFWTQRQSIWTGKWKWLVGKTTPRSEVDGLRARAFPPTVILPQVQD